MLLAAQILGAIAAASVALYLAAVAFGLYLKRRGQLPFDPEALAAEGGKYVTTADGRIVEYFTYGPPDRDARVVVNMHGSGMEAREQARLNAPICEGLGVRGIAISLPGFGYSDMQPGRQVKDWPRDDLAPVLAEEDVDRFMITGHSQGNPHAMAAAWCFGDRCEGLGLYAPFLPIDVSKEEGVKGGIGMETLPSTGKLRKWYMGWYFAVMHVSVVTFAPWLPLQALRRDGRNIHADAALLRHVGDSTLRGAARGVTGGAWESARDVCYEWGFDPRLIETRNVVIWHAADETLCPPEIGRWLAEMFRGKEGVNVNFRDDDVGFGHFTYSRGEFAEPGGSMVKALLDGCG